MPSIVSVGTAVPPFELNQDVVKEKAGVHFLRGRHDARHLTPIFDNVQVERRCLCVPLEWFYTDHSFEDRNREYIHWAQKLSIEAIHNCLGQADVDTDEITHFIFVSTSGLSTPSIDAHIINELGFNPHVRRTPLFGLGCAGGAAGLGQAARLACSRQEKILLVAVEISSLTFQRDDFRKSNLVATSLFSDGAAAVLLSGNGENTGKPHVIDSQSTIWPRTLDLMGWDFSSKGLHVVFSKQIPEVIESNLSKNVAGFLRRHQLSLKEIEYFILHPGGGKVLTAFEKGLNLSRTDLCHSRYILQRFGNMSSPTVLFILERFLSEEQPQPGQHGICAAFGPGFSSELVLLRW